MKSKTYEYMRYMAMKCSDIEKVNIHNTLVQGEAIDHYMHKKFTTFVLNLEDNVRNVTQERVVRPL